MSTPLLHALDQFAGRRALLIGDFMLDRYIFGDAERISPEAPVPVLRVVERQDRVGGAGFVALNVRALDAHVTCCGVLGTDAAGDRIAQLLGDAGCDVSGLLRLTDRPTITKTRLVGLAEHRHRQQILRVDDEVVRPLDPVETAPWREHTLAALPTFDVVCLQDYGKGVLTADLCAPVLAAAARHGKPVLVDPARSREAWSNYTGATLVTPNRAELEIAWGLRVADADLADVGVRLCERHNLAAILITLGRDGALLTSRDGRRQHFPTRPRAVYDNTGAGDAVLAMVAVALAAGASLDEAATLANLAGGLEVSKFGCVPITRAEVLHELRHAAQRGYGKLRPLAELRAELDARRQRGETVVFTNGCFDLLHPGHVDLLDQAKALGSVLVVGLNSDASVRRLAKGTDRPIRNEQDRARVLAALESVDYVTIFDEPDPARAIAELLPDVLVKGSDWAGKGVVGQDLVEARGGRVVLVDLLPGYSTTGELERIRCAGAK